MQGRFDYIDLITFSLYAGTFFAAHSPSVQLYGAVYRGYGGVTAVPGAAAVRPDIVDIPDAHELTDVIPRF